MPVKINSSGGGSVTLSSGGIATDVTATFPATTGNAVVDTAVQTLTNKTLVGAVMTSIASSVLTLGTVQASTSGTSIDFTGLPSWVRRVTVMFNGVSTNGTSIPIVQLGAGAAQTTGYTGSFALAVPSAAVSGSTLNSGFSLGGAAAASVRNGSMILSNFGGNAWVCQGVLGFSDGAANTLVGGYVALSGVLDRVRITTVGGTDTFDAGSINLIWE